MAKMIMDRMQFLDQIKQRQSKVSDKLEFRNHGLSVNTQSISGKELSKGCQSCKDGTWWCLYVGHRCNLDCTYCPQGTAEHKKTLYDDPRGMQRLWIEDIKLGLQMVKPGTIKGVSYSGGEPFLFLNKIIDMSSFISANFDNIYQWVYTNGLLVTNNKLQILYNNGIQEIRFHLGSTNFDKEVIKKLEYATKIFKYVTIETPGTPELRKWAIDENGLYLLQDFGIHQLNIAEQYLINGINHVGYEDTEVYSYTSMARGQHVSPIYSRRITYDIIEYAIYNNIDLIINDCSHESRDAQLITRELNKDRLSQMH